MSKRWAHALHFCSILMLTYCPLLTLKRITLGLALIQPSDEIKNYCEMAMARASLAWSWDEGHNGTWQKQNKVCCIILGTGKYPEIS